MTRESPTPDSSSTFSPVELLEAEGMIHGFLEMGGVVPEALAIVDDLAGTSHRSSSARVNVLFITLDQFRGDAYGAAGHPLVRTPTLDRHGERGRTPLASLLSGGALCTGSRRALHRHVPDEQSRGGQRHAARARIRQPRPRRAARGLRPHALWLHRSGLDPGDRQWRRRPAPRVTTTGSCRDSRSGLYLPESQAGWVQYLRAKGYDVPYGWRGLCEASPIVPPSDSLSGFLTTRFLEWLEHQESGWFAHLSYLRPHPALRGGGGVRAHVRPRRRRVAHRTG